MKSSASQWLRKMRANVCGGRNDENRLMIWHGSIRRRVSSSDKQAETSPVFNPVEIGGQHVENRPLFPNVCH